MSLPPVLGVLMPLYGVSYAGLSVLLSALLWSHVAMQVPAGVVADRLGVRPTLILGLVCMSLGNFLPALWPQLGLAIVGRVITGVGTGLAFVAAMKLVALYAPEKRAGAYQGYYGGFFSIGTILAYLAMPFLAALNWRVPYLAAGVGCLVALAMVPTLRLEPDADAPVQHLFQPLHEILVTPVVWVIGGYHALSWGLMLNLGNWAPSVLAEVWSDLSVVQLASAGALVMLISGLGRLSGGMVLMRFAACKVANCSILILLLTSSCLALIKVSWLVLFLMILAAWFSSVNFGALFYLAGRASPSVSLATVFGFVNLLANLGAILFTLGFGVVRDLTGSFSSGFAFIALLSALIFMVGRKVMKKKLSEALGLV